MANVSLSTLELRGTRVRKGIGSAEMAEKLGLGKQAYSQKERHIRSFSDREKMILVETLELNFDQFNLIFYEGRLPYECRNVASD